MSRVALAICMVAAGFAARAMAQDSGSPSLDFLEYLGSWQESDEEWLVVADELLGSTPAASEEAPGAAAEESRDAEGKDDEAEASDED